MRLAAVRVFPLGAAAALAATLLLVCGALETARAAPKPKRPVPIMVPIGCLMSEACEGNGLEAASQGSVVSGDDIARGGASAADRTSSDPRVYGADAVKARAAADKFLARIRAELRMLPANKLSSGGERPAAEPIIGPAPLGLRKKVIDYIKGDDFFNCKSIFVAMDRAAQGNADKRQRSDMLWALYPRYIESCFRGNLQQLGRARDRVVMLLRKVPWRDNFSPYCLGFNFAANYVLTARHCLVEPGEIALMLDRYKRSDPDALIAVDDVPRDTWALVLGEPGRLFRVRLSANVGQERSFFPFERDRDIAILEIEAPARRGLPPFPVAEAVQWDAIAIPAIFPDDAVLSAAIRSRDPARVSDVIDGASAVDVSPLCSLVHSLKSAKRYVYHACQTRFGYSGGPILRRGATGAMALVGVHLGAVDRKNPVDRWPYGSIPNYGLRLPPQVMEFGRR